MARQRTPNVRYYLYRRSGRVPIIAVVHYDRTEVRVSTGISIRPETWNKSKQRIKSSAANAGYINALLDEYEAQFQACMLELRRRGNPLSLEVVRQTLEKVIQGAYGGAIVPDMERYIAARRHEYADGTVKVYHAIKQLLERYEQSRKVVLTYNTMTAEMLRDMVAYMLEVERYANTQIQKVVKRLKTFLRFAKQQGWGIAPAIDVPVRIPTGDRIDRAYLRLEELERFRTATLANRHAIARDMFILQCYTGLRWSDVQRLNRSMYDGVHNEVVLITRKTRRAVRIPLLPTARQILERYEWNLPQWSNAYQNKLLKEALKLVGIDEPVVEVEYRGSERLERVVPKYEAISTHSAKRTFVSLLLSRGVTLETICKITGNTRASIEAYIHKDETEIRKELQRALEGDTAAGLLVSQSQEVQ